MFLIGNPRTLLWPNLPGAEKEAAAVEKVAIAQELQVTHPTTDAQQMVTSLMTGEYQIVHIAAHGQYDPDPMKSGVVISDRLFITPAEVARLPLVPELVFLNCCYLGKMGEGGTDLAGSPTRLESGRRLHPGRGARRSSPRDGPWTTTRGRRLRRRSTNSSCPARPSAMRSRWLAGDARQSIRNRTRGVPTSATAILTSASSSRAGTAGGAEVSLVTRSEALQALRTLASSARSMSVDDVPWLTAQFDDPRRDSGRSGGTDGELLTVAGEIAGELETSRKRSTITVRHSAR